MHNSAQTDAVAKSARQLVVIGIYRWLIEVAFLFAAFDAFPEHKWPIGLGLLAFSAGISGIIQVVTVYHQFQNVLMNAAERKTRHTIVRAAELVATGTSHIDQWTFWDEVDQRVKEEAGIADGASDKRTGFWKAFGLATGALLWQLAASLFGIALVAGMTAAY